MTIDQVYSYPSFKLSDKKSAQFVGSCVYFFEQDGAIKYVGQTKSLMLRLMEHRCIRKPNESVTVYYAQTLESDLRTVEGQWIEFLCPEWNKTGKRVYGPRLKTSTIRLLKSDDVLIEKVRQKMMKLGFPVPTNAAVIRYALNVLAKGK